jgi:hypothetical protein
LVGHSDSMLAIQLFGSMPMRSLTVPPASRDTHSRLWGLG